MAAWMRPQTPPYFLKSHIKTVNNTLTKKQVTIGK